MKIEDVREAFYEASGKTSDLVRNLSFAGIAIIWVFKKDVGDTYQVPDGLILPALFLIVTLSLDLLQYIVRTITWGMYNRHKEKKGVTEQDIFLAPLWINYPSLFFFVSKTICVFVAYIFILSWFLKQP